MFGVCEGNRGYIYRAMIVVTQTAALRYFFIYIPIGEQIKDLLQSGYVAEHMIDVVRNPGSFSDAVDGDMYQRVCGDPCIENLTLTWNYDGLPVYKSSGASLYGPSLHRSTS